MKKIKKEVDVVACEICNKEIDPGTRPVEVIDLKEKDERFYFHQECVDKLLIETAKTKP